VDIATVFAWVGPTIFITFWVIKKTMGLRASREEELKGLDIPEHGMEAYPVEKGTVPVTE
jgi:Amt family ammonium transporter